MSTKTTRKLLKISRISYRLTKLTRCFATPGIYLCPRLIIFILAVGGKLKMLDILNQSYKMEKCVSMVCGRTVTGSASQSSPIFIPGHCSVCPHPQSAGRGRVTRQPNLLADLHRILPAKIIAIVAIYCYRY